MKLDKYFDLFRLLKFSKVITISSLILALFSVCSAFGYSFYLNKMLQKNYIYVIDNKGEAFVASLLNNDMDFRKPEIHDHLAKFHSLFYNINQNNLNTNVDKALNLIGEEGKHYFITLDKSGWYKSIKLNNLQQKIAIELIEIDDKKYPYEATVYGNTTVERIGSNKNVSQKKYVASFTLINVERTMENPHGLMIEQYEIIKHE